MEVDYVISAKEIKQRPFTCFRCSRTLLLRLRPRQESPFRRDVLQGRASEAHAATSTNREKNLSLTHVRILTITEALIGCRTF